MSAFKYPTTIVVTLSPKRLRELANLCEEKARKITLGKECFVDYLAYEKDVIVKLNFDQERTVGSPNFKHE